RLWWLFPLRLVLDGLAGLLFLSQGKWRHILSIIQAHFAVYIRWGRLMHRRAQAQKRIEANRINVPADKTGRYRGSIVWQYYARNVHQF
ncbi:MAG TPA: bifunctional riboflavin kinase/FAD synthetase, partial [Saprospiraceae bacterium]|nr:bifunctional riboflavin kinase/FAD synthetase [Saprospiraceae bacterium]